MTRRSRVRLTLRGARRALRAGSLRRRRPMERCWPSGGLQAYAICTCPRQLHPVSESVLGSPAVTHLLPLVCLPLSPSRVLSLPPSLSLGACLRWLADRMRGPAGPGAARSLDRRSSWQDAFVSGTKPANVLSGVAHRERQAQTGAGCILRASCVHPARPIDAHVPVTAFGALAHTL